MAEPFDPLLGKIEVEAMETMAILSWLRTPFGNLVGIVSQGKIWTRLIPGKPSPQFLLDVIGNTSWQESMQSELDWNVEQKEALIDALLKKIEGLEVKK